MPIPAGHCCQLPRGASAAGAGRETYGRETKQVAHLTGRTIKLDEAVPKLALLIAHSLWLHFDLHQIRGPSAVAQSVTSWKAGPQGFSVEKLRPWWGGASHDL